MHFMVTLFVGFIDAFGSIKPLVARALGENFVASNVNSFVVEDGVTIEEEKNTSL